MTSTAPIPASTRPALIGLPSGGSWFPGRIGTDGRVYRLTEGRWTLAHGYVTATGTR